VTNALGTGAVDAERARAFVEEWIDERGVHDAAGETGRLVVESLLDAAYDVAPADPPRRRLAMSTAGAPVVYSHKCSPRERASMFRLLAEPGGIGVSVAEQIALSRDLLGRLLDQLGWSQAAGPLDAVLRLLIPDDDAILEDWHGGLGFGVDVGDAGPELRLYCNVRQGDLTRRWQRMLDVVGEFAAEDAADALIEMLQIATPRAVPAGLAVGIGDGALSGIRLYAGLLDATAESAFACAPQRFAHAEPAITRLVDSYRSTFGDLGEQGLTLAYDFAMRDGVLVPWVARYKVDLFCEPASGSGAALLDWIEGVADSLGVDAAGLRQFALRLDRHFPGWTFQYVSLGCRDDGQELTAYCVPGQADTPVTRAAAPTTLRLPDVRPAVAGAVASLLERRTARGRWEDFDTLAGASTDWVSAYVGLALAQTGRADALAAAHEAWARLRRRRVSAGWGYNGRVPPDADSTIWVMHLAAALDAQVGSRPERFLARHLSPAGAMATFANAGRIRIFTRLPGHSFAGWCGAHTCVTAAAAGLRSVRGRDRMLEWLRAEQRPEGDWRAYWWDSPYYATTLAAEALADAGASGDQARVERAVRWTAGQVEARGPAHGSPFENALALRALLLAPETQPLAGEVLEALTIAQRPDGSWAPSARLRIPPPQVTDPDAYSSWVEGGRGGGSVQVDQHACFTTATVLQALCAVSAHDPDGSG
jgi:hypothetical protein